MSAQAYTLPVPFKLTYITNVDIFIKVWGVADQEKARYISDIIDVYTEKLQQGEGMIRTITELIPGKLVLVARDGRYHRAEIIQANNLSSRKVLVFFIDLGIMANVDVPDIRLADMCTAFNTVPRIGLAQEYVLQGAIVKRPWTQQEIDSVNLLLPRCSEFSYVFVIGDDIRVINLSLTLNRSKSSLSSFLINSNLAETVNHTQLQSMLRNKYDQHVPVGQFQIPPPSIPAMHIPQTYSVPQQPILNNSAPLVHENTAAPPGILTYQDARIQRPQHAIPIVQPPSIPPTQTQYSVYGIDTLPPGTTHEVYVSHVIEGMHAFSIQLKEVVDHKLPRLMAKINDARLIPFTDPLGPGNLCLGRYSIDQSLCRAVVSSVMADGANLYFVDFGNSEVVSFNDIYRIPPEFIQDNVMALRFTLADLNSNYSLTTQEGAKIFSDLVLNEEKITMKVTKPEMPAKQYCELFLTVNNRPVNVKKLILDKVKLMKPVEYQRIAFKKNHVVDAVVSYTESPLRFFVQLEVNQSLLDILMKSVENYCVTSENKDILYVEDVNENMAVCACYEEDGKWYRGLIVDEPDNDGNVTIFYVDYGNQDSVHFSKLRIMNNEMMSQFPMQAIECRLNIDADFVYNEELNNLFIELVDGNSFRMTVQNITPVHVLVVDLVDANGVSITDQLKEHNVQKPLNSPPIAPSKPLQKSPSSNWRDKENVPSNNHEGDFSSFRREEYQPDRSRSRNYDSKRRDEGQDVTDDSSYNKKSSDFWGRDQNNKPSRQTSDGGELTWRKNKVTEESDDRYSRRNGSRDENKPFRKNDDFNANWDNKNADSERTFDRGQRDENSFSRSKRDESTWKDRQEGGFKERWRDNDGGGFNSRRRDNDGGSFSERRRDNDGGGFNERRRDNDGGGFNERGRENDGGRFNGRRRDNDGGGFNDRRRDNDGGGFNDRRKDGFENRGRREDGGFDENRGRRDFRSNDGGENWDNKNKNDESWGAGATTSEAGWGNKSGFDDQRKDSGWGNSKNNFGDDNRRDRSFKSRDGGSENRGFRRREDRDDGFAKRNEVQLLDGFEKGAQMEESSYEPGQQLDVVVTWFISPSHFYVKPAEDSSFRQLIEEIQEEYPKRKTANTNELSTNDLVVAREKDDVIYRASVLRTSPRGVIVSFVDYGNTETVNKTKVWTINPDHCVIPKQAIYCGLHNIISADENGVWNSSLDTDKYFGKDKFQMTLVECVEVDNTKIWMVNLSDGDQDVADQMVADGVANRKIVFNSEDPYDVDILLNQTLPSYLGAAVSSKKFFVHIEPHKANHINECIEALVEKPNTLLPLPMEQIISGEYCLAKSAKNKYYRALILTTDQSTKKAQISFIDYGDECEVNFDEIRILPKSLMIYNAQVVECCLFQSESFEDDDAFVAAIEDKDFIIKVMDVKDNKLHVKVFNVDGTCLPFPEESSETVPVVCPLPILKASESVYITAVTQDKVYLQRVSDQNFLIDLNSRLFNKYDEQSELEKVSMETGKFYAAKSADFEGWYRCLFDEANPEYVYYIDYGNSEPIQDLLAVRPLEEEFFETPACCIIAQIPALLTEEFATLLDVVQELVFRATFKKFENDWMIDLVDPNGKVLAEHAVEAGCGEKLAEENVQVYDAFADWKLFEERQVVVSAAHSPCLFYIQLKEDADKLALMQQQLNDSLQTVLPLVGNCDDLCASKYNGQWYRCWQKDNFAIDYGYFLDSGVYKKLPSKFSADKGNYVLACGLNVDPAKGEWDLDAISSFKNLVCGDANRNVARLEFLGKEKIVELMVNETSVTETMVNSGEAIYKGHSTRISHSVSMSEFYVQLVEMENELYNLSDNLVEAENWETVIPEVAQLVAAKFVDDELWYRAEVISATDDVVTVRFIDYGNEAVSTEFRVLPDELKSIPKFAYLCSIPLPNNASELNDKFVKFIEGHPDEIFSVHFLSRVEPMLVMLYFKNNSIDELLQPKSFDFSNVSISHINSPSSFYVQGENAVLDTVGAELENVETTEPITNVELNSVYAAKYDEDGLWYRAKVIEMGDTYTVLYIDYGNVSVATELRSVPSTIEDVAPLAKHCAIPTPPGLLEWPEVATQRFAELSCHGDTVFKMDVIEEGDPACVHLTDNGISVMDEVMTLCQAEMTAPTRNEKPNVVISFCSSSGEIWVQEQKPALDELCDELVNVETFDDLETAEKDTIVAALFDEDGAWYRAKILDKLEHGFHVLFIDYGNESGVTSLKALPEDLAEMSPFAICCRLLNLNESEEIFNHLKELYNTGEVFVLNALVEKDGVHYVSLKYEDGRDLVDELNQLVVEKPTTEGVVSDIQSLTEFSIQEDIQAVAEVQSSIQNSEEFENAEISVGNVVSALDETDGTWYRSRIESVENEDSYVVTRIDFGGKFVTNKLKSLPQEIAEKSPLATRCTLKLSNELLPKSGEVLDQFIDLAKSKNQIFQIFRTGSVTEDNVVEVQLLKDGADVVDLLLPVQADEIEESCESNELSKEDSISLQKENDDALPVSELENKFEGEYVKLTDEGDANKEVPLGGDDEKVVETKSVAEDANELVEKLDVPMPAIETVDKIEVESVNENCAIGQTETSTDDVNLDQIPIESENVENSPILEIVSDHRDDEVSPESVEIDVSRPVIDDDANKDEIDIESEKVENSPTVEIVIDREDDEVSPESVEKVDASKPLIDDEVNKDEIDIESEKVENSRTVEIVIDREDVEVSPESVEKDDVSRPVIDDDANKDEIDIESEKVENSPTLEIVVDREDDEVSPESVEKVDASKPLIDDEVKKDRSDIESEKVENPPTLEIVIDEDDEVSLAESVEKVDKLKSKSTENLNADKIEKSEESIESSQVLQPVTENTRKIQIESELVKKVDFAKPVPDVDKIDTNERTVVSSPMLESVAEDVPEIKVESDTDQSKTNNENVIEIEVHPISPSEFIKRHFTENAREVQVASIDDFAEDLIENLIETNDSKASVTENVEVEVYPMSPIELIKRYFPESVREVQVESVDDFAEDRAENLIETNDEKASVTENVEPVALTESLNPVIREVIETDRSEVKSVPEQCDTKRSVAECNSNEISELSPTEDNGKVAGETGIADNSESVTSGASRLSGNSEQSIANPNESEDEPSSSGIRGPDSVSKSEDVSSTDDLNENYRSLSASPCTDELGDSFTSDSKPESCASLDVSKTDSFYLSVVGSETDISATESCELLSNAESESSLICSPNVSNSDENRHVLGNDVKVDDEVNDTMVNVSADDANCNEQCPDVSRLIEESSANEKEETSPSKTIAVETESTESDLVYVTYVNNPGSFYVQRQSDSAKLVEIEKQLTDAEEKELPNAATGSLVMVKIENINLRAKIVELDEFNGYDVLCIDRGIVCNTKTVYELPESLQRIPSLAKHCGLPLTNDLDSWPESVCEEFVEITQLDNPLYKLVTIEKSSDDIDYVNLIDGEVDMCEKMNELRRNVEDQPDILDEGSGDNVLVCSRQEIVVDVRKTNATESDIKHDKKTDI